MEKKKYKLLAISPFKGFQEFFLQEVQKRNDIEADIYSAALAETPALIESLDLDKYEAIICRGRSGQLIKEIAPIPVVNIDFSSFDILRALQLATLTVQEKIAFVSYFDLRSSIQFFCELLHYKTNILVPPVPRTSEEMAALIRELYDKEGVRLFVGDGACVHCAKELNAETILVTTGPESMHNAILSAIELCDMHRTMKSKDQLYKTLIQKSSLPLAIFNEEKTLLYSGLFTSDYTPGIHEELKNRIPKLQLHGHIKTIIFAGETAWKVSGEMIYYEGIPYYLFSVAESIPATFAQNQFWKSLTVEETKTNILLVKGNPMYQDYWEKAQSVMDGKTPVVICGEPGSGRNTFSYALYASSPYRNNPLIEIDCFHLNERQCEKLFTDERSPLFEHNYTILFKNMNALSTTLQNKFCFYFEHLELTNRNKIICTFTGDIGDLIASNEFSQNLSYLISGFTLRLPSLNAMPELIVPIARSYLNLLNQEFPIQLAGISADALKLLEEQHWEFGISQFQTVLKQLAIHSNGQYITEKEVQKLLTSLTPSVPKRTGQELNLNQTLEEITKDILKLVLEEESMNQTKAAKRLGISRSTLWKRLQE